MVIQLTAPSIAYVTFRHWIAITVFVLLGVLGTVAYCLLATPLYEADAQLVVKFNRQQGQTPGLEPSMVGGTPPDHDEIISSYLLQLQSNGIAQHVINTIGLATMYPNYAADTVLSRFIDAITQFLGIYQAPQERAVYRLVNKDLDVQLARNSNVIQVGLYNADATVAKRALALLIDRFLEQEARIGRDPQIEFVQSKVDTYRKQVTDAQAAMEKFQLKHGIAAMDEETTYLIKQRSDLEAQLNANNVRIAEARNRVLILQQQMTGLREVVDLNTETRDPALDAARTQLVSLQIKHEMLRRIFEDASPAVQEIQAQIAKVSGIVGNVEVRSRMQQTAVNPTFQVIQSTYMQTRADLEAAVNAQPVIAAQLRQISARLTDRSMVQATYQDLVREYQIGDQNYRVYLQGVQQARTADDLNALKITTISVFDPPHIANTLPARPRYLLIVAMGIFLGLFLGFSTAFLLESWDEKLNTQWQVTTVLGLPLLGSMGRI